MIQENERKPYAGDLNGSQWAIIVLLFPPAGNKSKCEKRELAGAVLYLADNGCKRRNLPRGFPPYTTWLGGYISARIKLEWEFLPKRWIVERSLAWFNNSRRLSKDYEISVRSAQTMCVISAFHTLLKRF